LQRLPWVIRNQCLSLSMTARVRSFEWLFLAGILLRWIILKPYILPQHYNGWSQVSKELNYFRCWATSAKAFIECDSSIIVRTWFQSRPFWKYDCLLEASGFLGRQQLSLAKAQYSRKFKLKFIRILVTHPVFMYINQINIRFTPTYYTVCINSQDQCCSIRSLKNFTRLHKNLLTTW